MIILLDSLCSVNSCSLQHDFSEHDISERWKKDKCEAVAKFKGFFLSLHLIPDLFFFFSFRHVYPSNWDLEMLLFIHANTVELSRQAFSTSLQGGDGVASMGLTLELRQLQ